MMDMQEQIARYLDGCAKKAPEGSMERVQLTTAAEWLRAGGVRVVECPPDVLTAARAFATEFRKEFRSAQAEREGWAGYVDGFDATEPLDVAYLALVDALGAAERPLNGQFPALIEEGLALADSYACDILRNECGDDGWLQIDRDPAGLQEERHYAEGRGLIEPHPDRPECFRFTDAGREWL